MQITIDTSLPLNDVELQILAVLVGQSGVADKVADAVETQTAAKKAAPKAEAKPAAKKAAAKKPEPEPEEEPEPMAEEPLEDEEEPEEEEETEEDADDVSDEDLLAMAVKKATEMVAGGDAAKVREALDAAGASRVRELNKDNVRDFFKALP